MGRVDTWSPGQYQRFAAERAAPFHDLLALVRPVPGGRVVDLGCGSGELTAQLHRQVGAAETLGLDSSPAMLEGAAGVAGDGLRFAEGDIGEFREGGWDVVFSNAALHWLPDHAVLFGRLAGLLHPGGQLAVQMPANHDHPSHVVAAEVAGDEPFRTALDGYRRVSPVQPPSGTPSCSPASPCPTSTSASRCTCTTWRPATRSSSGSRGPCSPTTSRACPRSCSRSSWLSTAGACSPAWRTRGRTGTCSSACWCGDSGGRGEVRPEG